MSAILALLWRYRTWVAYALVVAALVGLLFLYGHRRYAAGEAAGRAQVQALWDDQQAAQAAAVEAQARAVAAQIEADREAARKVERELQTRLAAADAASRDTARRLQDYWRSRCRPLPAPAAAPGEPAAPGGVTGSDEAIGRATEDVYAACGRDAERLNGWEGWWMSVSR